jgi:hypothetical protein
LHDNWRNLVAGNQSALSEIGSGAEFCQCSPTANAVYLKGMCQVLSAAQALAGEMMCAPLTMRVENAPAAK